MLKGAVSVKKAEHGQSIKSIELSKPGSFNFLWIPTPEQIHKVKALFLKRWIEVDQGGGNRLTAGFQPLVDDNGLGGI